MGTAEQEVNRNAEAQRRKINEEMDHMRDLIETKRQQLLSKSSLEERQKRMALQSHVDKVQSLRSEAVRLTARSEGLLGLSNEHAFLAVVLPLIQEMKKTFSPGGRTCATAFGFQATPDRRAGEGSRRSRSRSAQTPATPRQPCANAPSGRPASRVCSSQSSECHAALHTSGRSSDDTAADSTAARDALAAGPVRHEGVTNHAFSSGGGGRRRAAIREWHPGPGVF